MVHVLCSVIQASQQGVSIKITEVGEDLLITTVLVSIYLSALLSTCIQECSYLHVFKNMYTHAMHCRLYSLFFR